ncbi:WYL domain-containing protein [Streptomyces sp. NPDC017056]|uniref:WYL domain-containing protein n=1 Tax=Streptomyces sp. NPDC017056 TaxID=3364973 RepID=UPI0037B2CEC0
MIAEQEVDAAAHRPRRRHRPYFLVQGTYGLVAKAGTWYLVADRRQRPQLFRADRVLRSRLDLFARIVGPALTRPPEDDDGEWAVSDPSHPVDRGPDPAP